MFIPTRPIVLMAGLVLALALASGAQAQTATEQDLAQVRQELAKLKLEHDEAMSELRELKAQLQAQADGAAGSAAAAADEAAEPAAEPADEGGGAARSEAAALLERIADQQQRLEAQVDRVVEQQRQLDLRLAAAQAAAPPADAASSQTISSPYAYRTQTGAATASPAVASKYTIYSNGYSTDSYVPPVYTRPAATAPVYVSSRYTYYNNTWPVYRPYYYCGPRVVYGGYWGGGWGRGCYGPRISFGVVGGKGYFGYSSGGSWCR